MPLIAVAVAIVVLLALGHDWWELLLVGGFGLLSTQLAFGQRASSPRAVLGAHSVQCSRADPEQVENPSGSTALDEIGPNRALEVHPDLPLIDPAGS